MIVDCDSESSRLYWCKRGRKVEVTQSESCGEVESKIMFCL